MLGDPLQHLDGPVVQPRLVVGHRLAFGLQVPEPELDGVHAEDERDLLHVRVDREDRVRRDGRAIGGDARLVREHLEAAHLERRPEVETRQEYTAHREDGAGERARLDDRLGLERHQRAVTLDAALQTDDDLGRRVSGLQLLPASHHVAHRAAGGPRERGRDRLTERADLAAEAAAALHRDDLDGVLGQLENLGHLGPRVERPLRARPQRQLAVGVPLGQHRVRFQVALVNHRDPVGLLDDHVGLGEALGHVAAPELRLLGDVDRLGRLRLRRHARHAAVGERFARIGLGSGFGDGRRSRLHGLERIDGGGQHLVADIDEIEGFLGDRQLVGGHRRDRLPDEDHAIDGQHGVGARRRLALQLGNVGGRDDRAHARKRPRPARVDTHDTRVSVRAAQELGVQQAARLEIGDVLHLAGHLFRSVRPRDGEPDALDVTRGLHRRRHGLKPSGRARRPRLR